MRLIKTPAEIECLRVASEATIAAHERAMRFTHPGANEYQVHAEIIHEFLKRGCMGEAYQSIIAGGENACILHYIENNHDLKDGDLLLIDAGAKYDFLCADVTRTFPVNGKFSGEQKAIYEIVLEAQLAVIDKLKPGLVRSEMAETAIRCITQGLVDLGLLKGNVDSLIEQKAYRPFYMHDIGHWLGRDVHDVGRYKVDGQWRNLEKDMVMTVEPGIYIKPGLEVDEKWWGIGVRIEDNLLITDSGSENFTKGLAKSIADVEALTAA
jgi:Xaa-Pro aminopeptidase